MVIAVCKAADPNFKAPRSLIRSVLRGDAVFQNVQFALNGEIAAVKKPVALDLVLRTFSSVGLRATDNGTKIYSFTLGDAVGIEAQRHAVVDEHGRKVCSGIYLHRRSGNNLATTLCIYDKARQMNLSPGDAIARGLADVLRFDVTLRKPCQGQMFTAAKRLAKQHGRKMNLKVNASGQVICSAANIAAAVDVFDRCFSDKAGGRNHVGFGGWLAVRVVREWFHLDELFGFSRKQWKKVEKWMNRWSAQDKRYRLVVEAWRAAESPPKTSLRSCFKAVGHSD